MREVQFWELWELWLEVAYPGAAEGLGGGDKMSVE